MTRKIFAFAIAVVLAAALTLGAMLALVEGTISAVSITSLPLRIGAVLCDLILGSLLLIGCIWIATRLAVELLGVGNEEFPPIPADHHDVTPPKN